MRLNISYVLDLQTDTGMYTSKKKERLYFSGFNMKQRSMIYGILLLDMILHMILRIGIN